MRKTNLSLNCEVKVLLEPGAKAPVYSSSQAAGADICACLSNISSGSLVIEPHSWVAVPTGIHIQLPVGFEAQIRPRSGLAAKFGVTVLNAPGTIDSDYRGEIKVLLINHSNCPFVVNNGDRIAQMVVAKHEVASFEEVSILSNTERGVGGFGSTGIKSN